jgi:predicted nucleic acid-binding protein
MSGRSFFDTDVLVYSDQGDAPEKRRRSLELLADGRRARTGVVSTQVLQEYFVTVTRKLGVDAALARRKTEIFGRLHVVIPRLDDILGAIDLVRMHRLSFWDGLVIRSALVSGCSRLLSEDLQHGRRFDALEVVNPFVV